MQNVGGIATFFVGIVPFVGVSSRSVAFLLLSSRCFVGIVAMAFLLVSPRCFVGIVAGALLVVSSRLFVVLHPWK